MRISEYLPENEVANVGEKLTIRNEQTRRQRLTLRHLNKLKKVKERKKLEQLERLKFMRQIYNIPDEHTRTKPKRRR